MRARLGSSALCSLVLLGCDGSASVGHDTCSGVDRCTAPAAKYAVEPPEYAEQRIARLDAAVATDRWTIDIAHPQFQPLLHRDADGTVWSLECDAEGKRLVLRGFDASGAQVDEREEPIPEPQPIVMCELSLMESRGAELVVWLSLGVSACDPPEDAATCGSTSIPSRHVVFADGLSGTPQWSADAGEIATQIWGSQHKVWDDGDEPAYWLLQKFDVVRVDVASGEATLRQTALSDLYGDDVYPVFHQWSELAPRPGGGVMVAAASEDGEHTTGFSEVLALDADGRPVQRLSLPLEAAVDNHALRVDALDRLVLLTGSVLLPGDLVIRRVSLADGTFDGAFVLQRDGYFDLTPSALTEDARGNFYFALVAGSRDEREQVLCVLPLEGALTCTSIGNEADVVRILPGDGDVIVQFASEEGWADSASAAHYVL